MQQLPISISGAPGRLLERCAASLDVAPEMLLVSAFVALIARYTGEDEVFLIGRRGESAGLSAVAADGMDRRTFRDVVAIVNAASRAESITLADEQPAADLALVVSTDEQVPARIASASLRHDSSITGLTAARVARHFETLLMGAAGEPNVALSGLPLFDGAEQQTLIAVGTSVARPVDIGPVHLAVAAAAQRSPNKTAVVTCDGEMSYSELVSGARRLARHLIARGVARGSLVGICLPRSAGLLPSLLAVAETGAAYVPIDPAYPSERVAFMLSDAQVAAVITETGLLPLIRGAVADDVPVIRLDADAPVIEAEPDVPLGIDVGSDDLAYVIYTSGSTGVPKGVMVRHGGLSNFLSAMRRRPGLDTTDTVLAVTTLSFDIAGLELFLPLVCGATVVVATREKAADGAALVRLLKEHGISVLQATPATWRMLLDAGWRDGRQLRALCGGEAMTAGLAGDLLACGVELWNMYGPTETTIWSSIQRVSAARTPDLGDPIDNTQLYVVDTHLNLVPVGVPGELLIGGAGLARGYLHRPDLTAERFVEAPFAAGATVYHTGDLVRRRDDGGLEFLGRIDHQVKVHGFRIELGEIEVALTRRPDIQAAVVAVQDDRLIAYVLVAPGEVPNVAAWHEHIAATLPPYMVPHTFIQVDRLPQTPNGKIDRKALTPSIGRQLGATRHVRPRDALETELVAMWEETLGISVGVCDNFFDLGIDSLTAARLFARIEAKFGRRLGVSPVFQAPTIEQLASLVRGSSNGRRWSALVPIVEDGERTPLFCVHGGSGTILLFHALARRLSTKRPVYGLQAVGLYGGEAPQTTLQQMADRYLGELRHVQPHGPYALAGWCFGGLVAYEMAHRLIAAEEQVYLVAMLNTVTPGYDRELVARERAAHPPQGTRDRVRMRWSNSIDRPFPARVFEQISTLTNGAVNKVVKTVKAYQVQWALRRRRPLPDHMREAQFRHLAFVAGIRYVPQPATFPLAVFRSAGEYDRPDLGWDEVCALVQTFEIAGGMTSQRTALEEPYVRLVADPLEHLLELHEVSQLDLAQAAPQGV
ncbi:MAG: non-ribosomal peptide synthetase [Acidothermaceae bacterium]